MQHHTPEDRQHPRAHYALGLLMAVALFAYIDRVIIAVLQEGIRRDLGLSDTQLGTLTGMGFALFYTVFALPVARLADLWVRKYVIAIALGIWSLTTALSGLATGFLVLLLLRVCVAVGEAGSVPTSHALISDYFAPQRRATALAIWSLMMSVGPMLGFLVGGRLQDLLGWRDAFTVIGLAGLALVPLIVFTLPEPRRGASDPDRAAQHASAPPLRVVVQTVWQRVAFRYLCLGTALHTLSYLAMVNWSAPFYQRSHGLSASDTGTYMGLMIGIGGIAGTLAGGLLADRLGKRDLRWYMRVPAIATLAVVPLAAVQFHSGSLLVSVLAGIGMMAAAHIYAGPVNATQQSLVPAGMRAMISATTVLVVGIVGLGLGPLLTGIVSDALQSLGVGADSLRYAVTVMLATNLVAAWMYFRSAALLPQDMAAAHREAAASTASVAPAGAEANRG